MMFIQCRMNVSEMSWHRSHCRCSFMAITCQISLTLMQRHEAYTTWPLCWCNINAMLNKRHAPAAKLNQVSIVCLLPRFYLLTVWFPFEFVLSLQKPLPVHCPFVSLNIYVFVHMKLQKEAKLSSIIGSTSMTLGQQYHTLKGLDVGKCHTKFQLSSPEGMKVISCKRNADVNLHLNLPGYQRDIRTYAHRTYGRNITAKCYMPRSCQGRQRHKKKKKKQ